jgi:hypothetical protein
MVIKIEKRGGLRRKLKKNHPWRNTNICARRPSVEMAWIGYIMNVRFDKKLGVKY